MANCQPLYDAFLAADIAMKEAAQARTAAREAEGAANDAAATAAAEARAAEQAATVAANDAAAAYSAYTECVGSA